MMFSYGASWHQYAIKKGGGGPKNLTEFYDRDPIGQTFGFEVDIKHKQKNEFGFGFSKQVHRKKYVNESVSTSLATISFENFIMRDISNYHTLHWKRHLVKDKLLIGVGIYNQRFNNQFVTIIENSDETLVNITSNYYDYEFGAWYGIEYYKTINQFQVGIKARAYQTYGYFEVFDFFAAEISPVVRFNLSK